MRWNGTGYDPLNTFFYYFDHALKIAIALSFLLLLVIQVFFLGYPVSIFFDEQAKKHAEIWLSNNPVAALASSNEQNAIWSTITIKAEKYTSLTKAKLLVNGHYITDFRENPISVRVSEGDLIEIDASFYETAVSFKITAVSGNLANPKVNDVYIAKGSKLKIGINRNKQTEVQ